LSAAFSRSGCRLQKKIKFILSLISLRYYFHVSCSLLLLYLWIFLNVFSSLYCSYFSNIYFGKFYHIVKFEQVWKISYRVTYFLQKIFFIFFAMIFSSDIFLFSFKASRRKIMRKISRYTPFQLQKRLPGFTASFRGFHLFLLTILTPSVQTPKSSRDPSSKLVRKIHIGTLLLQKWHSEVLSLSLPSKWSG